MPANIVNRIDTAILIANDQNRIGVDVEREIIAGISNLARMAREQPAFAPDRFEVVAIDVRIGIKWPEQTVTGGLTGNKILNDRGQCRRLGTLNCGTDHA